MTMDARKQRVLQAIVALYGLEGEPVGSSVLANYFDMAVSSATLRNEMAALTKLGLLEQPHTSAGRVPSAKGYRYYLDNLLTDDQPLDRVTRARVEAVFASLDHEPEKLAQGAAKALAAISGCTAAVSTPCAEDLCVAHYEVVQVGRSAAAVLAVTTAGYVRTRVARVRTGLSRENAAALAALLNRNLTFVAPVDLSNRLLAELCSQIDPELVPVISAAAAILQDSAQPHVFLGGEQYLLNWPQLEGKVGDILTLQLPHRGILLKDDLAVAGGEDLEGVAAADTLGAADLLRDDHPAQLIDAADDSGCFHLCTILPILHFPMLCSYYVEAEGKYTPARPVFAKQGRL